jgi:hypothetical protein
MHNVCTQPQMQRESIQVGWQEYLIKLPGPKGGFPARVCIPGGRLHDLGPALMTLQALLLCMFSRP